MSAAMTEQVPRPFFPLPARSQSPHSVTYIPPYDTIVYSRLESIRIRRLGMDPDKYSRYYSVKRNNSNVTASLTRDVAAVRGLCDARPRTTDEQTSSSLNTFLAPGTKGKRKGLNLMAPFTTLSVKPTCGYYFRPETDNKRKNFGIPAADIVRYRNFRLADRP